MNEQKEKLIIVKSKKKEREEKCLSSDPWVNNEYSKDAVISSSSAILLCDSAHCPVLASGNT